jgi:hypothetical protein
MVNRSRKKRGTAADLKTAVLATGLFGQVLPAVALLALLGGLGAAADHTKQLLPHRVEVAAGVHAAGFSYQFGNANSGWVEMSNYVLLIDLPRGTPVSEFVSHVETTTGKPVRQLVLTNIWEDKDWQDRSTYDRDKKRWRRLEEGRRPDAAIPIVEALVEQGVTKISTSMRIRERLLAASSRLAARIEGIAEETEIGDVKRSIRFIPLDAARDKGAGAVFLPSDKVLFGGPLVYNGTRTRLAGHDVSLWIAALARLEELNPTKVVPGFGTWEGTETVTRLRRLLKELRDQVSHGIAAGYSLEQIQPRVRLPVGLLFWSTHTRPRPEDIAHVYRELTVPSAPFGQVDPRRQGDKPRALVLIGDSPHPPAPIEEALRPVFEATGVTPFFTVDVDALNAENLSKVDLFVILRDGRQVDRVGDDREKLRVLEDPLHGPIKTWMSLEQEQAVVKFVEGGGSFLNLHNSLGLYPPAGPYLKLVGGRYIGHGAYERFRVEVADPNHPITEGAADFTTADEQHTPVIYDEGKVHLILTSRMDNGTSVPAGWAREAGKGRVCHLAGGHPVEPLVHPTYQKILRNAVEWCLRKR